MQAGRQSSTSTDTLLGKTLGGYQLVRRIGSGGMGAVYEARHAEQGTRAAVKVLNRELAQDTTLLERFRREAQITASLSNPHTIKVFDFDQPANGPPYMVMEYLDGEDLESRLKREQRLTPPQAQEVLRGLGIALTEAHRAGVVHRDLKPGNIFFAKEGVGERVKLLDFGLSKALKVQGEGEGLTAFGQILGTVWYMSPEQTRGVEATAASDIYSVGVVLYQMLTGALPFEAASPYEYLFRIQTATPRPLAEVAPDLPPGLEGVIFRAMAREPAERFSSARELSDAYGDLFSMASDQTSMARAPVDPRQRSGAMAMPPRVVTNSKVRAAPRAATNPKLAPVLPKSMSSDPHVRTARTLDATEDSPLTMMEMQAPVIPDGPEATFTPSPDATVVRPMRAPADEGEDSTYVRPSGEGSTEGATRVTAAPVAPPKMVSSPKVASLPPQPRPMPVARPTTDPEDFPEATAPGVGAKGIRPLSQQRPAVVKTPPTLESAPPEGLLPEQPEEEAAPSSSSLYLGLGIGAGLGVVLLIAALAWRFVH